MRLVIVFACAAGCASEDAVYTRGCNETGYALESLMIDSFTGPLASASCTPYEQQVDNAYAYTYVRFVIGQDEFVIRPIDYVGETPLSAGRWSYVISIADYAGHKASVHAVADD